MEKLDKKAHEVDEKAGILFDIIWLELKKDFEFHWRNELATEEILWSDLHRRSNYEKYSGYYVYAYRNITIKQGRTNKKRS